MERKEEEMRIKMKKMKQQKINQEIKSLNINKLTK